MSGAKPLLSISQLDFTPSQSVHPSPTDWRDHFIYFLLVDRFDDSKWHLRFRGKKPQRAVNIKNGVGVHGGTLKGVMRRLEYLKNLGATVIWLSPVFKNRIDPGGSLHGYAIQNFLEIDPHFGTKEDLRNLVNKAHKLGMYVVLDIVINHTGDNWGYKDDMKPEFSSGGTRYPFGFWRTLHSPKSSRADDAVWPAELQDPDCYTRRGMIVDWNNPEQAVLGDFFNLKTLDLNYPPTLETLIAIYKYWIAEADIDGYRVDTVKHVDSKAAVKFFNSVKEYAESIGKKNFLMFGEIVDGDAVIAKYVGNQLSGNERIQALDASLDFPLYFVLDEVIKGKRSPAELRGRYDSMRATYQHSDGSNLLITFLDNHDQMSRPYRRFLFDAADERQGILGVGYLLTALGIPSLYYGTEQGFNGGGETGDHKDNLIRECMFGGRWGAFNTTKRHFFNQRHNLYKAISRISRIRAAEPALRYGRFYFREISEDGKRFQYPELGFGFLAYSRILDDREVVVVLNLRGERYTNHISVDRSFSPPGVPMINALNQTQKVLTLSQGDRSILTVTLEPYEIAIFKRQEEQKKK